MSKFLVFLILLSPLAYAVDTQKCPKGFRLSYSQLVPMGQNRLASHDELKLARQAILKADQASYQNLQFQLVDATAGICVYRQEPYLDEKDGEVTTRLYSSRKDFLRVTLRIGGYVFQTRHTVLKYSEDRLTLDKYAVTPLLSRIQNKAYKIGWAVTPTIY